MPNLRGLLDVSRPDDLSAVVDLANKTRSEGLEYFASPIDWRDEMLDSCFPTALATAKRTCDRF